ncbi:M42 family metallopeptidase [Ammoniphilus sp. CFH 90114]|uniref:M42 family metallopeptidase n=1 Tax=Ammoniphilus sp. CFH 90114 TaxID=2493665 RepID=UPI00100F691D|nr:M42 family metallopeptidase [Ammoniphilus sp. CFH 90114]RXT13617.1 M42 family peptidase [Ammoniphilus sp. CFH 90114]
MKSLDYIVEQLVTILNIPSPSGNTEQVIRYIEQELTQLGVPHVRNHKGGVIATLEGKKDRPARMLTAHVDTLGAMVKEIHANGTLRLTSIGGFRWHSVKGEYCWIETAEGKVYTGTILSKQPSVHVYREMEKLPRTEENMIVRLDEVTRSAEETRKLGIEVGDFVSFDPRVQVTDSGFIKSRHLDDKASVAILLGVIKQIVESGVKLPYTTYFLISNNEEIGYGGNSNIPLEVKEYLAVDMGAIGEGQTTDEYCVSICAKDSSGPYHKEFRQKLVKLAQEVEAYYKVDIYPYYGSDASAALRAGHDIIHGLIGPGIDASHSHERTHKEALENTAKLIRAYLESE